MDGRAEGASDVILSSGSDGHIVVREGERVLYERCSDRIRSIKEEVQQFSAVERKDSRCACKTEDVPKCERRMRGS